MVCLIIIYWINYIWHVVIMNKAVYMLQQLDYHKTYGRQIIHTVTSWMGQSNCVHWLSKICIIMYVKVCILRIKSLYPLHWKYVCSKGTKQRCSFKGGKRKHKKKTKCTLQKKIMRWPLLKSLQKSCAVL